MAAPRRASGAAINDDDKHIPDHAYTPASPQRSNFDHLDRALGNVLVLRAALDRMRHGKPGERLPQWSDFGVRGLPATRECVPSRRTMSCR